MQQGDSTSGAATDCQKSQPPAAEDYYYFRCKAKKEFSINDSVLEKLCPSSDPEEVVCVPPINYRYNFHEGPLPHVAVAVEEIPTYFTKKNSQSCVPTIRTLGIVRRLEHEFYALESINEYIEPVHILLTRGTNRPVKGFRTYRWARKMNKKRKKRVKRTIVRKITAKSDKLKDSRGNIKIKGLPFPDSVRDPLSLGDTRAIDGGIYVVLGRLQWANNQPIIDVHKFIPVHDYESTYESFVLQHAIARRRIAHYQAHPAEIGKVVQRPYENRKLTFLPPVRKRNGKGSKIKTKTESISGSRTQSASYTKKYIGVIDINLLRAPRSTNISS